MQSRYAQALTSATSHSIAQTKQWGCGHSRSLISFFLHDCILARTCRLGFRLVRFISYVHTMERSPTWKVDVYEPTSPNSATNLRRCPEGTVAATVPPKSLSTMAGLTASNACFWFGYPFSWPSC